ncbi:hypothetical protein [Cytobacillus praedii]|uniref:hypothetical protein n=1 Tax=Cytobacillus praedii TaxID=1742358 RepID=UPI002E1D7422|nr:hypothetical protein [Cytobacillus praedii]
MNKNALIDVINKDFPDYKIINIEEFGFPILKKEIVCLATISKGMPVVMDFTLKLLNLKYNLNTIAELLAIDFELVKHAAYDLEMNNMISLKTLQLTDEGRNYIRNNRYESMKRVTLPICIDSYSGYINKNKNYVSNKSAKALNLKTVKPLIDKKDNTIINGQIIKRILKNYIKERNTDYEGELVEIVKFIEKPSEYRRLFIAILESPQSQLRYIVYDKNVKLDNMENLIHTADESGISFYNIDSTEYLKDLNNAVLPNEYKKCKGDYLDIFDPELLNKDYSIVSYSIPLLNVYKIEDDWINSIENYIKKKLKVSIKFTGIPYPSPYFKNKVLKLLEMESKYKEYLSVSHSTTFEYAYVFFEDKYGYFDKIDVYKLDLKSNLYCIKHELLNINSIPSSDSNGQVNVEHYSKSELKSDIIAIQKRAKELDTEMEETYGLNWLIDGQILNEPKLESLDLASNYEKFSNFTKELNAALVEVLNKVGKSQELTNYMFNKFKEYFPELFDALNRLRVYRNSMQHNDLDEKNLKAYKEYIEKDLNGQFPEFIENGYLYLQKVIVKEILEAIKTTSKKLNEQYI